MTYWATLWCAGAVVLQLGYEGQTLNDCELLTRMMRSDIEESYADPSKIEELSPISVSHKSIYSFMRNRSFTNSEGVL